MAGLAHSAGQVWPAFALVTGLVLVGVVAEGEGLFAAAGALLARAPAGALGVYTLALGLVAVVTAVLNLDTSVVFLTPVLIHLARVRGLDEAPFLYGAVTMSNAASLYLPGSNLTNLIVLHGDHVSGATFLARMWTAALVSTVVSGVVLALLFRRELRTAQDAEADDPVPARLGIGAVAIAVATVLVLATSAPALPVLATGVVATAVARVSRARISAIVDLRVLGGLFLLAVLLGGVGRWWHGPASLVDSVGRWPTAAIAAVSVRAREQPPGCGAPHAARARASTRTPPRTEPRPQPRRHRLAVGVPLAANRAVARRGAVDRALLTPRNRARTALVVRVAARAARLIDHTLGAPDRLG